MSTEPLPITAPAGALEDPRRAPAGALGAMALAGAVVGAWLLLGPPTPDLAAQVYRVQLFAAHGFALYDANWYGGHLLPAYSVLFPPFGAAVGVRLAGALATAASIVLFDRLARAEFGRRGRWGTVWFALGAGMNLLSARLTFALGMAVGLGALLAARRDRTVPALGLAAACPLASPLAGLFLALAGSAWAIGARRSLAVALAGAAAVPLLGLQVAFPEGGTFPFPPAEAAALLAVLLGGLALLPPEMRTLRAGLVLYALLAVVAFAVSSPLGSNCARLALIAAGPVLACALNGRRAMVLAGAAPLLVLWSWMPSVQDLQGVGGPGSSAAYYAPLERFLRTHESPPSRVEIPFTRAHWESVYVARDFMLARGWERQLDRGENPIFYRAHHVLDARAYHDWLRSGGVRYVAVPDVALDESARAEVALIARRPPYLREVFTSRHWRVYRVLGATPLLSGPGRLLDVRSDSFAIDALRPGRFLMRLHFSPYWQLQEEAGCVMRGPNGWTELRLRHAGLQQVTTDFGIDRALNHGRRCT
ncbi:MAG: hypothetical protein U0R52_05705 [Solirubrobacterales bacterium]